VSDIKVEAYNLRVWYGNIKAISTRKNVFTWQKDWVGPYGEIEVLIKDEGVGLMIIALQSQEFVFGLEMSAGYSQ
jgi:hypothetical protein